jgi:NIMA (never in mitosis gene a)-related kinase
VAKLGDMNVSKVTEASLAYTQTGTPYYASPEVWREEPYSYKSDIWSLGCVLYEMCTLRPPFRAKSIEELYNKVQKGVFERVPMRYSQSLANMIADCLVVDVKKRSNLDTLLQISSMHQGKQSRPGRPNTADRKML